MPSKKSAEIQLEPTVLKWFIDKSGWKYPELAKRISVSENTLNGWLSGDVKPTIKQIEKLALVLKRPFAAFLLSSPPKEKPPPKDYRMIPGKEGEFDKKTLLAMRKARRLQHLARELSGNLKYSVNAEFPLATLKDDPTTIANDIRSEFLISKIVQQKWKTPYEAFNSLRDVIESKEILVFQVDMSLDDARGFALADELPYVIVINKKDSIKARLFTLMHEFAHILIRKSGVSMPELSLSKQNLDEVEKWCNSFSSEFLLPSTLAKEIYVHYGQGILSTNVRQTLSNKYKVSKSMFMYKMKVLGYVSENQYKSFLDSYDPNFQKTPQKKEGKKSFGGVSADKRCIHEKGHKFVHLVTDNLRTNHITRSEALDLLSVKSRNLDQLIGV